jgi:hypothetical protein
VLGCTPWRRPSSSAVAPASSSRRIDTICDSVKRVFRVGVSLPVSTPRKSQSHAVRVTVAGASPSNAFRDGTLDSFDSPFIAFIKGPLLDPLAVDQACLRKDLEMHARGRLANIEFPCDEATTDAVFHEIAVDLRRKVRARILQPFENLKALIVGHRAKGWFYCHVRDPPIFIISITELLLVSEA